MLTAQVLMTRVLQPGHPSLGTYQVVGSMISGPTPPLPVNTHTQRSLGSKPLHPAPPDIFASYLYCIFPLHF